MIWFVTGATGQLGLHLIKQIELQDPENQIYAPTSLELNLSSQADLEDALHTIQPDIVVNSAAWTDVDGAEANEEEAMRVNAVAPQTMAATLRALGSGVMVQLSTDYVFSGGTRQPYTEADPHDPLSVYGATKAQGESVGRILPGRSVIARTAWLYDTLGSSFVARCLDLWSSGSPVRAVADQYGHPTWVHDAAVCVVQLGQRLTSSPETSGTYHVVNSGIASWYQLAIKSVQLAGGSADSVVPISNRDLIRAAQRPTRTELLESRLASVGLPPMRSWSDALAEAISNWVGGR